VVDRRQLVTYIAIFALLIGALGTLTYFQLSKYWTCKEKIAGLEKERAAAQALLDQIPGLRKEAKALSDQIEVYAEILPKEQEVRHDAFVETMDRFARETGLQILRADPFERKNARRTAAPTTGPATGGRHATFGGHSCSSSRWSLSARASHGPPVALPSRPSGSRSAARRWPAETGRGRRAPGVRHA